VEIVSVANPQRRGARRSRNGPIKEALRERQVGGRGDLHVARIALDEVHRVARAFHERCLIGGVSHGGSG
jgi:hypothetical protein